MRTQLYTPILKVLKVLDVESEPLCGQVRWRVEIEAQESDAYRYAARKSDPVRFLSRARTDARQLEKLPATN